MSQPEHELARKIVQHLDYGLDRIEPRTTERLAVARRAALARYRPQPEFAPGLVRAGQAMVWFWEHRPAHARALAAAAALVLAAAGVYLWQGAGSANDLADVEISLLTDELPINAYLDKGFDSWLKRSSR